MAASSSPCALMPGSIEVRMIFWVPSPPSHLHHSKTTMPNFCYRLTSGTSAATAISLSKITPTTYFRIHANLQKYRQITPWNLSYPVSGPYCDQRHWLVQIGIGDCKAGRIWTCAATQDCIWSCNCISFNVKKCQKSSMLTLEKRVYNRLEGFRAIILIISRDNRKF